LQAAANRGGGRRQGGGGAGGGNRNNNNNNNNSNNRNDGGGRDGRGGGGRGGGGRNSNDARRGGGGRSTNDNGGRGGGRGGGGGGRGGKPQRMNMKDIRLLEATGNGNTPAQQAVIRITAREFVRQRLRFVEPCTDFSPHEACRWTDENRLAEIQALCSKVMELGDVSKAQNNNNEQKNNKHANNTTAPPLEDCKPIETNEGTRWKSKAMSRQSSLIDEVVQAPETTEELVSRGMLILNKISWTTLERLTGTFLEQTNLAENNDVRATIIDMLVHKAQIEPHFAPMYAQLCATIAKQVKPFKKELLTECQKEFETDTAHKIAAATQGLEVSPDKDKKSNKADEAEIEYHSALIRKAYIGHMKFLGELYLRDVVKLTIMMYCLDELLKEDEHEESLECFAQLMTTMGEKLDGHSQQNKKAFDWQKVHDLRSSTKISNRIKFLLQDLLELRDRGKKYG
jgi:hypothetical protein